MEQSADRPALHPLDKLRDMMDGCIITQMLYVAAKLRLADHLVDGPKSSKELATLAETHPASTFRLMRALSTYGLFDAHPDGRFALNPVSEFLVSDAPASFRLPALLFGNEHYRALGGLLQSVQSGRPSFALQFGVNMFEYNKQNPEAGGVFIDAMRSFSEWVAANIVRMYDFSDVRSIVDVGGGAGGSLLTVLKAYPKVSGVLFDLPHVLAHAKEGIDEELFRGRCQLVAGNLLEGVPEGHDVYMMRYVMHEHDDESASRILLGIRRAMDPKGRVLVIEQLAPQALQKTDFWTQRTLFMDLVMLTETGGRERTEEEYRDLFSRNGFHVARFINLPSGQTMVEAFVAS